MSKRLASIKGELGAVKRVMGLAPDTCPWNAFADPEVGEVLRGYDFSEPGQLAFYAGDDPSWRLVEGIQHYHRAVRIARADVDKVRKANDPSKKPPRPPRPRGMVSKGVQRG